MSGAPVQDPVDRFNAWLQEATRAGVPEPTAMAVATADAHGAPNVRMVLLKGADARGFVFYTNLESPKARELAVHPRAALCFHWPQIKRQVRVSGAVTRVADTEADTYFATRPRLSQLGAWGSAQSRPMTDVLELERNCAAAALRFGVGAVPRPSYWSGFRVVPDVIEFWQECSFRWHERVRVARSADGWISQRIFP